MTVSQSDTALREYLNSLSYEELVAASHRAQGIHDPSSVTREALFSHAYCCIVCFKNPNDEGYQERQEQMVAARLRALCAKDPT